MWYLFTAVIFFVGGVVVARLWWGKIIGLGHTIALKAEGDLEKARAALERFHF